MRTVQAVAWIIIGLGSCSYGVLPFESCPKVVPRFNR